MPTSENTKLAKAKKTGKALDHKYREITVEMTNGEKFKTRSTYINDYLKLDIDPTTHPAWTKETNYVNTKATEVTKFNNKFRGLSFSKPTKKV